MFMISSRDFTRSSWSTTRSWRLAVDREEHLTGWTPTGVDINEGRTSGRPWAVLLAASGQLHGRQWAGSHGRRQDPFFEDRMTLAKVYHYPTEHFRFHEQQLTLR